MAVTASPYGLTYKNLGLGLFDFSADTFKMLLTTSSYTPNFDTHEFIDDVTSEITGTGYTAGGETLSGVVWTYDTGNDWCLLTCDPVEWTGATFSARRGVVYKDTGTASTSPLLCWVDFGADAAPVAVPFTVTFSSGLFRVSTAA